jgi:hypothetical protein
MTDVAHETAPSARARRDVDLLEGGFADAADLRVKADPEPRAKLRAGAPLLIKLPPRLPDGFDRDMDSAPDDGKPIWTIGLDPQGRGWTAIETVWRHTRYMRCGQWQQGGFWAVRNAGGTRLPYTPVAWTHLVGI